MKLQGFRCPHCGNRDIDLIESNLAPGERVSKYNPEETLLCVARIHAQETAIDHDRPHPLRYSGTNGKDVCGMQWDPREEVCS